MPESVSKDKNAGFVILLKIRTKTTTSNQSFSFMYSHSLYIFEIVIVGNNVVLSNSKYNAK